MGVIGIRLSDLRGTKVEKPSLWSVVFLDDPTTPVDFVEEMIVKHFGKTEGDAKRIIYGIEKTGEGVVGTFTLEVAETKQNLVVKESRANGFELNCRLEKV